MDLLDGQCPSVVRSVLAGLLRVVVVEEQITDAPHPIGRVVPQSLVVSDRADSAEQAHYVADAVCRGLVVAPAGVRAPVGAALRCLRVAIPSVRVESC
jgi:hypothetical protein